MQSNGDTPFTVTEQDLIERAKLTGKPTCLPDKCDTRKETDETYYVNEEFLIATAVLSETARKGQQSVSVSSKSTEEIEVDDAEQDKAVSDRDEGDEKEKDTDEAEDGQKDASRRQSEKDSIDDEVFDHATETQNATDLDKDVDLTLIGQETDDRERDEEFDSQTAEQILIAKAELTASELGKSSRSYQEETFRFNDDRGRQLSPIPRLEIYLAKDVRNNDEDNADGYKTPVNSENVSNNGDAPEESGQKLTETTNIQDTKSPCSAMVSTTPRKEPSVPTTKLWKGRAENKATDSDFYRLVIEIANEMSEEDFEDTRAMFRDTCDINAIVLKSLDSPFTLLNWLRCHHLISRDNMHHLQVLLKRLANPLLHTRAMQYVRHHCDVIHFYAEPEDIPSNYGKIRCHLGGKDFTRLKRTDLELARFSISALVFLPVQHVYIVGIEPGLLVTVLTLILPDRYMFSLRDAMARGSASLAQAGIDTIDIDGVAYNIQGGNVSPSTGDHKQFLTIYQQLREKTQSLEERNAEVIRLKKEAEWTQLELETMSVELELLTERAVIETRDRFDSRRRPSYKILKAPRSLEPAEAEIKRFPNLPTVVTEVSGENSTKSDPSFRDLEGAAITGTKMERTAQRPADTVGKRRIWAELERCDQELMAEVADMKQTTRKHASTGDNSDLLEDIQDILHELKSTKLF